jgi:AcrR family transcriptional regulator
MEAINAADLGPQRRATVGRVAAGPAPELEGDTRTRLLRAGAHLFARHGIDGVRVHDIHVLAGQRNESAIHYHFGDRGKLVAAILEEQERLVGDRLRPTEEDLATVEGVVTHVLGRLAIGLETPAGRDWLRIVSELMAGFRDDRAPSVSTPQPSDVANRLARLLPELPAEVVMWRTVAILRFTTGQVAERARQLDAGEPVALDEHALFAELLSMGVAMLRAPHRR